MLQDDEKVRSRRSLSAARLFAALACAALACAALAPAGCTSDNPRYCEDDAQCQDPSWEHHDPATPVCHPTGHMCYAGCKSDEDCTDPSRASYEAGKPRCNPSTGHCYAPQGDGGADAAGGGGDAAAGPGKKNGEACAGAGQCQSGHCVDGVCCDGACGGTCMACALPGSAGTCSHVPAGQDPGTECTGSAPACGGSCDGQGACAFASSGTSCGADSCSAGQLTQQACDGLGACKASPTGCGGYACNTAGTACKSSCNNPADCTGSFQCVAQACVNDLNNGAACGANDAACKSKHCVDGVCCDAACAGTCEACDLTGKAGTCTALAGLASQTDCPGDATCGPGTCTAAKTCSYPKAGTSCKAGSCAGGSQTVHLCSAAHVCTAKVTACSPYTCDAASTACRAGCTSHAHCVAGSLCDRRLAHTKAGGAGACVTPSKVVAVGASEEIADALSKVSAAKPFVSIPPKASNYLKQRVRSGTTVAGKTVHLVGTGSATNPVVLDPSASNVPAVAIADGMTVTVQGLVVQSASGTAADGIYCGGNPTTSSALTVLESTIQDNKGHGVVGSYCDVTLRRNAVLSNDAGGVDLSKGTFVVVNNVVAKNGVLNTSNLGGMSLNTTGKATVYNNTIASNLSKSTVAGGIKCSGGESIVNAIVYGNLGSGQVQSCAATYSNVQGGATGTGNIDVPPSFVDVAKSNFSLKTTSACIDKGAAAAGVTTIDVTGGPRKKGAKVDLGAYEVK